MNSASCEPRAGTKSHRTAGGVRFCGPWQKLLALCVQLILAFSLPFTPATAATFTWQGFYGLGTGVAVPDPLVAQLCGLLGDTGERARLGAFGRDFVVRRYALDAVGERLVALYRAVVAAGPPSRPALLADVARTTAVRAAGAAKAALAT